MNTALQSKIKNINSFTRQISIVVPAEELGDKFVIFLKKFSKKIRLPGFRKGKVPVQLVRKQFGPAAEADFAEHAVQEYYLAALAKEDLEPINQATVTGVSFREGQELRFEATFEVEPELTLPKYQKGMKFQRTIYDRTASDVDQAIEDIRERRARLKTVEDGITENLYVVLDFQEVDESGTPLIGRKMENQLVHLEPTGPFGGENLTRLKDARVGDVRPLTLKNADGVATRYEVTVRQVSERILPDLDDVFAREVDEEADTLADFRRRTGERLDAAFTAETKKQLHHNIEDHFVQKVNLDAPTSLFENYLDNMVAEMERDGYPADQIDRQQLAEAQRAAINWNIKWFIIRKTLIAAEDITVEDEAVEARIEELALEDKQHAQQIRRLYKKQDNRRNLRVDLLSDRLMERLLSYAKVKEVHKPSSELRKAE